MTADTAAASAPTPSPARVAGSKAKDAARDIRLDFYRGVGMFIILIAHIRLNTWPLYIPARFGWSDATEIFVFCSGAASAFAFYRSFQLHGSVIGTARVGWRIWQIYWCHIGVLLFVAAMLAWLDGALGAERAALVEAGLERGEIRAMIGEAGAYVGNLGAVFTRTQEVLIGLFTLSYVPGLFDILVMYMVILAMMPIVIMLGQRRPLYAGLFVGVLWVAASQPWMVFGLPAVDWAMLQSAFGVGGEPLTPRATWSDLPASPWNDKARWFFNPFAWQLVFFTGFAFAVGWLPAPPVNARWIGAALAVVIVTIPFAFFRIHQNVEWISDVRGHLSALYSKTYFGLLRYVHFLAVAYLAWAAAGPMGAWLPRSGIGGAAVTVVRRVGQQSLAVFIASLPIARLLYVYIDQIADRYPVAGNVNYQTWQTWFAVTSANLIGFAALIAVAYIARYFRSQPWRAAAKPAPNEPAAPSSAAPAELDKPATPGGPPDVPWPLAPTRA